MSFFSFLFDIYPKFITSLPCTSTKQFGLPFSIWFMTTWKRNMATIFYYIYLPDTFLLLSNSDELSSFTIIFLNLCIFLKCKVIYLVYFFCAYALLEFTNSARQSIIFIVYREQCTLNNYILLGWPEPYTQSLSDPPHVSLQRVESTLLSINLC